MKTNRHQLKSLLCTTIAITGVALASATMISCEDRKPTLKEKIGDGLDTRPNEKAKDTVEDVKDAVKDATN